MVLIKLYRKREDENGIESAPQGLLYCNLERIYNRRIGAIIAVVLCFLMLSACTSHHSLKKTNFAIISYYDHKKVVDCGKKKIVLIGGCFDLLHYGHFEYLRRAKSEGEYLIVALEPDERIVKYNNRQPFHNQKQREANLSAIRSVDHVLMLPELQGYEAYRKLVIDTCPNVIAVTQGDPQLANIKKQAADVGAEVKEVVNLLDGMSSSLILKTWSSRT